MWRWQYVGVALSPNGDATAALWRRGIVTKWRCDSGVMGARHFHQIARRLRHYGGVAFRPKGDATAALWGCGHAWHCHQMASIRAESKNVTLRSDCFKVNVNFFIFDNACPMCKFCPLSRQIYDMCNKVSILFRLKKLDFFGMQLSINGKLTISKLKSSRLS